MQEFLKWYQKSKKGPRVLDMALAGGPKNAGKKPSTRKRTNKQKPAVTTVTDLLPQTAAAPVPVAAQTTVNVQPVLETPVPPGGLLSFHPRNSTPILPHSVLPPTNTTNAHHFSEISAFPSRPAFFHAMNSSPTLLHGIPPNMMHSASTQQQTHVAWPLIRPQSQQQEGCMQLPNSANANHFTLKWLAGTRVSRCYGCNGEIRPPPPESVHDDLVVVYRDVRQYRSRDTGQIQYTQSHKMFISTLEHRVSEQGIPVSPVPALWLYPVITGHIFAWNTSRGLQWNFLDECTDHALTNLCLNVAKLAVMLCM